MDDLHHKHCVPCEGNEDPLTVGREDELHSAAPLWEIHRDGVHQISRHIVCANFKAALEFLNAIGAVAEAEGHHPNLSLFDYKNVRVELYTHAISGLSENDFIMAVRIDDLIKDRQAEGTIRV